MVKLGHYKIEALWDEYWENTDLTLRELAEREGITRKDLKTAMAKHAEDIANKN